MNVVNNKFLPVASFPREKTMARCAVILRIEKEWT